MRLLLVLLVLLAGCSSEAAPEKVVDFRGSGLAACPSGAGQGQLGDLALPCMDGSGPAAIRGPPVVNLGASWCGPCAKELPAFERLHSASGDRLTVLGVVTNDSATRAVEAAKDIGLSFPQLYDRKAAVQAELGRVGLPVTVFLDGRGEVVSVYNGAALTDAALRSLVREHLGVAVS